MTPCPIPVGYEAGADWGYCPECGCQNTGCSAMPPLDGCDDEFCIPCGHYAWQRRMADEVRSSERVATP
jgi:Zn ribbon nucleic-acid-binding protein